MMQLTRKNSKLNQGSGVTGLDQVYQNNQLLTAQHGGPFQSQNILNFSGGNYPPLAQFSGGSGTYPLPGNYDVHSGGFYDAENHLINLKKSSSKKSSGGTAGNTRLVQNNLNRLQMQHMASFGLD